ncbi:hypothetical protein pEaSNUABM23_00055 [Erwinia phage pEa_SNUABM_23]|uniref:Uncharacterized protein n=1 Tax=Erwinia phage pEa_SNUABM_3 TaxID=2869552 RepID=A0AAE7XIP7_9CAUD|nr:hypothetical protein MPK68_gp056 [Erwinia phage pEa_SNUABM_3]QZE56253.1 hypothetical protein pEaSNUABM3_00056 [Erwinia phage pEa_SNUABM_3]QZE56592.1 hypothetical protein pEaSNUABM20_00056 [Erwinia phage pEa_SNUABM_20]UAW52837.1 hypothetical protein pEaSNUABM23_00055 [Erwinia phage pEa_SNUABM_23]UIW10733.1 hypothetical protein pEaSNUABM23_00055 [Erwinia phage pEa_SNUABM_31]
MTKQHVSYSSAFAIGESAILVLDSFGQNKVPYGVIEGVMFYGRQRLYRVSLFVNEGTEASPEAFLHQGRPVDGFIAQDLKPILDRQYIDHIGHVGKFERTDCAAMGDASFIPGQLVEVDIDLESEGEQDKFNIPVVVTGVTYVEGKVLYEVSIQRAYYNDGRVNGGRLVRDTLSNIDSIYLKPVGGWPETVLDEEKGDATLTVKGNGTIAIDCDAELTITAKSISIEPATQTNMPISNDLFDAAYEAHLLGIFCGDNNKQAARNFLGQYIREQDKRLENFRALGSVSGRVSGLTENQSAEPRSK